MTAERARLVEAGIRFEERRQDSERTDADPAASPELKFEARHRANIGEIVLLIRAEQLLRRALQ